jgi:hypothetical protein
MRIVSSKVPGYSGKPLAEKLGIKPGSSVFVVNAPKGYRGLLEPLPEGVSFLKRGSRKVDIAHVFVTRAAQLSTHLTSLRAALDPNAALWVSWPKKSAKVATDVTEDTIRALALPRGWVDNKVCAVTEIWSGLQLVVRKELR